ncbi:hypothetical protein [Lacinutrix sp. MEBiC02404]
MSFKIRENRKSEYVIIDHEFESGINFVLKNNCPGVQLRSFIGVDELDLKSIEKLKNILVYLSISNIKKAINAESIYSLDLLKDLVISENVNFELDIKKIINLESLGAVYSKKIINYNENSNLNSLVFSAKYPFENFKEFSSLKKLEVLHLYKSKIVNVDFIENILQLKSLKLAFNPKLNNISSLNKSKSIKILEIEKCKSITDFSSLENNDTIEELFISELDSLHFIKKMKNLKKINFWNCKDGDMKPLIETKSLEEINFYPNKKHYSHTLEEILELTGAQKGRNE